MIKSQIDSEITNDQTESNLDDQLNSNQTEASNNINNAETPVKHSSSLFRSTEF